MCLGHLNKKATEPNQAVHRIAQTAGFRGPSCYPKKENRMKIEEFPRILEKIVNSINSITNNRLSYKIFKGIDAAIFPDKVDEMIGEDRNGLYIFSSKTDGRIHYVGISNDVVDRFYAHIGKGYSWSRNGEIAKFPHCTLVSGRHWLDKNIENLFKNAEFIVTFIIPEKKESKELIEKYLIFYGWSMGEKIAINVMQ